MIDIYFDEKYGKLYENIEHGEACIFKCETENGIIINQFIKWEIPLKIDENTYYDIVTPYGYGGPYIQECINKEKLLIDYKNLFSKYCKDNNIVAEFVRFHPIYKNHLDFLNIYDCFFNRYTCATNIRDYDNPVQTEFSRSCRKTIRQVLNNGVSFKMIEHPTMNDLKVFQEIYYMNMDRKHANNYYYFDDSYFKKIFNDFQKKYVIAEALFNDVVIAAGLYFVTNKNVHAHLSGTNTNYLYLSPAYVLKYGTVLWAKENKYNYIHYGGGTDSSTDNPLYLFKCKFAQNTKLEFWIGKKIWNEEIYNKLCDKTKVSKEEDFFPAYRQIL